MSAPAPVKASDILRAIQAPEGLTAEDKRRIAAAASLLAEPPRADEAEEAILAGIVEAFWGAEAGEAAGDAGAYAIRSAQPLRPEDFGSARYRRIYRAAQDLANEGRPAIPALLKERLRQVPGEADADCALVDELAARRGSYAHQRSYADQVRTASAKRSLYYLAQDVAARSLNGAVPAEILEHARQGLERVESSAAGPQLQGVTPDDILDNPDAERAWLVEGLIPRACMVALCSPPKEGKSRFTAHTIAALSRAGSVIGLDCPESATVIWVTEESETTLRPLLAAAGLRGARLVILPRSQCGGAGWRQIVEAARVLAAKHDAALVIFDTFGGLAGLAGEEENQAGPVLAALRPLRALTAEGRSVLLTHHLSKDPGRAGVNALRGSSAFGGEVDGFVLLRREGGEESSVRVLTGAGRGDGWVRGVRYELDPDGSLRRLHGRGQAVAASKREAILAAIPTDGSTISQAEACRRVGGKRADVIAALDAMVVASELLAEPGERGSRNYSRPVPARREQVGTGAAGHVGRPVPAGGPLGGPGNRSPSPNPGPVPSAREQEGTA